MSDQTKEIEALPPTLQDFKAPDLPDNKPVLFFHPYNFHAQKVSNRMGARSLAAALVKPISAVLLTE